MTLQNERFEELLSRQLAAELEPQRGRAMAAFKAQLAAEAVEREAAERQARQIAGGSKKRESWARREVSGPAVWMWAGLPSLIAASLAVVLTLHFMERPTVIAPDNPIIVERGHDNPTYVPNSGSGGDGGGFGGGEIVHYSPYEITPNQAGMGSGRRDLPLPLPPASGLNSYQLPQ
jgi:hypothetical protein